MALPTTGLTLHCDAKDTDKLFTTYVATGTHVGTPVDGSNVEVWDDEVDGISDVCLVYASAQPVYKSTTPLMKNPCLDFATGTGNQYKAFNQTGLTNRPLSDFIVNNAFTIIVAFYATAITNTSANAYENHGIIADFGQFSGLFLRDVSGVKKLRGYNWDGAATSLEVTVELNRTYIGVLKHESGNLKLAVIDDAGSETSASDVASGNTTTLTGQLIVGDGGGGAGGTPYKGLIGEFAIWNVALTGQNLIDAKDYFKAAWLTLAPPASDLVYAPRMAPVRPT